MAYEIRQFVCTIPVGTLKTAPITIPLVFPARIVTDIEIIVPDGVNGVVGFQIANSGQAVIPYNPGQFIVTNDEKISWPLHNAVETGAWQLIGYNTGFYPHNLYVRFLLDVLPSPSTVTGTPALTAADLAPLPDPTLATIIANPGPTAADVTADPTLAGLGA